MAVTISGASLAPIYERMNGAAPYNPATVETYEDWATEAGDIITVMSGSDSYSIPVHGAKMTWRGTPQMQVNATGQKERDAVERVSKQKYSRGGGLRNDARIWQEFTSSDGYLHSFVYMTESVLMTHFDNELSDVHSEILQTASQIYSSVYASESSLYSYVDQTATYIRSEVASVESGLKSEILQTASQIYSAVYASESSVYSYVDQTATYIRQEVVNTASSLSASINTQANRISLVVQGTGANAKIKAAEIVAAINDDGTSSTLISADKVSISGTTTINDIMTIAEQKVYITTNTRIGGDIMAETLTLRSGASSDTLSQADLAGVIKSASVSGNTLTLTPVHGDPITFSKATTLSGAWSGGVYTVTASPQGNTKTVGFDQNADSPLTLTTNGTPTAVTANPKSLIAPVRIIETLNGVQSNVYTANLTIDGTASWEAGYDKAKSYVEWPEEATAGTEVTSFIVKTPNDARTGKADHTFQMTKGTPGNSGYATVTLSGIAVGRIDISNWYTTGYSTGYSAGETAEKGIVRTRFGASNGTYYIEAYENKSGSPSISDSSVTYKLATSGSTSSTKVIVTNASGTQLSNTPEINVGSLYTAGYNAGSSAGASGVTLSGSWSSRTFTVTASNGKTYSETPTYATGTGYGNTDSITVNSFNSSHIAYARVLQSSGQGGNVLFGFKIDASGQYSSGVTDGKNAVTISKGSWSSGKVSFTKSEGTASTQSVQLTAASATWSGNTASVVIWDGTAADAQHGVQTGYTVTVDASDRYNAGVTAGYNATPTNFETTAPAGASSDGYTNREDGYSIGSWSSGTSADVFIVVKGTWKQGTSTKTAYSYLQYAPSAIYRTAYATGIYDYRMSAYWGIDGSSNVYIPKLDLSGQETWFNILTTTENGGYILKNSSPQSFATTAPSGQTYVNGQTNLTNNSEGYDLRGSGTTATAYIVVKGNWTQGGASKEGVSYLQYAATNLYKKGYSDGGGGSSSSVTISSVTRSGATITATASNGATGTLTLTAHANSIGNLQYIRSPAGRVEKFEGFYKYNGNYVSMGKHYWFCDNSWSSYSGNLYTYYD